MKYIRKVLAFLRKADETFSLISKKDRILVGISGGKDSMALLHALSIYRKFSQKDFAIVPVSLDLGFPGFDMSPLQEYAATLGLTLRVEDSKEVYPILQAHQKKGGHLPCSICSRMKKAAINAAAKKYHCNKVAFAHHQDDALETLFMNMIHGGKVATFEPEMRLSRAGITFIRPFIFVSESDIRGMIEEEHIPVMGKTCPADGFTEREYIKRRLASLYEERSEAKTNFASMLTNYEPFLLYFERLYYSLPNRSEYALKPLFAAKDVIAYNKLVSKFPSLSYIKEGEKTFLLTKNKKVVGRFSYSFDAKHVLCIRAVECLLPKEESIILLKGALAKILATVNPLYCYLKGKGRRLVKEIGFAKNVVPNHYDCYGIYLKK